MTPIRSLSQYTRTITITRAPLVKLYTLRLTPQIDICWATCTEFSFGMYVSISAQERWIMIRSTDSLSILGSSVRRDRAVLISTAGRSHSFPLTSTGTRYPHEISYVVYQRISMTSAGHACIPFYLSASMPHIYTVYTQSYDPRAHRVAHSIADPLIIGSLLFFWRKHDCQRAAILSCSISVLSTTGTARVEKLNTFCI